MCQVDIGGWGIQLIFFFPSSFLGLEGKEENSPSPNLVYAELSF